MEKTNKKTFKHKPCCSLPQAIRVFVCFFLTQRLLFRRRRGGRRRHRRRRVRPVAARAWLETACVERGEGWTLASRAPPVQGTRLLQSPQSRETFFSPASISLARALSPSPPFPVSARSDPLVRSDHFSFASERERDIPHFRSVCSFPSLHITSRAKNLFRSSGLHEIAASKRRVSK